MKYYTVERPDLGAFSQVILDKIKTQELFQKRKNLGQNPFKKRSKFQKFQLSNSTLTWSNEEKVNSVRLYMTYSKGLKQKMKILDKLVLKTFELNNFSEILCHGYIQGQQSLSDGY